MHYTPLLQQILLLFCCFVSIASCVDYLPGSVTPLGRGYDSQDEQYRLLPVFDARCAGRMFNASECSPYISGHGDSNCFLIEETGRAYDLPWFVTASNYGTEAFAQAKVTLMETMAQVTELFTKVTTKHSGGFLHSSETTTTKKILYQVMAVDDQFLAYVQSIAKYYTVYIDMGILEMLFLESGRELVDSKFVTMVDTLPEVFDETDEAGMYAFFKFLRAYGDYLVIAVDMGASMEQFQAMTSCVIEKFNLNSTVTTEQSSSLFKASFDLDVSIDPDLNLCLMKETTMASFFRGGEAVLMNSVDREEWAPTTWTAPTVVSQTVTEYVDIITSLRGRKVSEAWSNFTDWYHAQGDAIGDRIQEELEERRLNMTAECCIASNEPRRERGDHITPTPQSSKDFSDLFKCGANTTIDFHCGIISGTWNILEKLWDALFDPGVRIPYPRPELRSALYSAKESRRYAREAAREQLRTAQQLSRNPETGNLRMPPLVNGQGFFPMSGDCTGEQVVTMTYNENKTMYSPSRNATFDLPDQMEATDEVSRLDFATPLSVVADLDAWVSFSVSLELVRTTLFDVALSWAINLVPGVSVAPFNTKGELDIGVAAGFEGGETIKSFSVSTITVLETADYAVPSLIESQQDSPFQQEVAALPSTADPAYLDLVCKYGEEVISNANYGGQFVYAFTIEAEQYYKNEAFYHAQASLSVGILQCILGDIKTISFDMTIRCEHPDVEKEFWEAVTFSISIVGGDVPQFLGSFNYAQWVASVQENPGLLSMQLTPLPEFVEDETKKVLLADTLASLATGEVACDSANRARAVPSGSCYKATNRLPAATFTCSTSDIETCVKDIDSCCSLHVST